MHWSMKIDPNTHERYIAVDVKGRPLLLNPYINKGTAFPQNERRDLELDGMIPPAVAPIEQQLERVYQNFQAKTEPLEKFIHLASLQDRNDHQNGYSHRLQRLLESRGWTTLTTLSVPGAGTYLVIVDAPAGVEGPFDLSAILR